MTRGVWNITLKCLRRSPKYLYPVFYGRERNLHGELVHVKMPNAARQTTSVQLWRPLCLGDAVHCCRDSWINLSLWRVPLLPEEVHLTLWVPAHWSMMLCRWSLQVCLSQCLIDACYLSFYLFLNECFYHSGGRLTQTQTCPNHLKSALCCI